MNTKPQFIRVSQVAERYSVARVTIYRWLASNPTFPRPLKLGKATLFSISELEAWEQSSRQQPAR